LVSPEQGKRNRLSLPRGEYLLTWAWGEVLGRKGAGAPLEYCEKKNLKRGALVGCDSMCLGRGIKIFPALGHRGHPNTGEGIFTGKLNEIGKETAIISPPRYDSQDEVANILIPGSRERSEYRKKNKRGLSEVHLKRQMWTYRAGIGHGPISQG